jgi:hypothetical protein
MPIKSAGGDMRPPQTAARRQTLCRAVKTQGFLAGEGAISAEGGLTLGGLAAVPLGE